MVNFFQPSMKLLSKTRNGAKTTRRYDEPKTPHQRLMGSADIPPSVKDRLAAQFGELNPAEINRQMVRLQGKLIKMTVKIARSSGGGSI